MRTDLSRRSSLRILGLGSLGALLAAVGIGRLRRLQEAAGPALGMATGTEEANQSPLAAAACPIQSVGDLPQADFTGDAPARPHAAFWAAPAQLSATLRGRLQVVIVGGGVAGLVAAQALQDLQPLLLEQAPQLGGNARGERWGEALYGLGAAYLGVPEAGTPFATFLDDLGLTAQLRQSAEMPLNTFMHDGQLHHDFWQGGSDPARADAFTAAHDHFMARAADGLAHLPPSQSSLSWAEIMRLDRLSFADYLRVELGPLHPHLDAFISGYCSSSLGAPPAELSAAQALAFLCSDLRGVSALPGGNAAITEALAQHLSQVLPAARLQTGALVLSVVPQADGVRVHFRDAAGHEQAVEAAACLFAAPKFIAAHVVTGLPPAQRQAMQALRYSAYLVANVRLRQRLQSPALECFTWRPEPPAVARARAEPDDGADAQLGAFSDFIFGSWAQADAPGRSVLTCYRALPAPNSRSRLLADGAFERAQAAFRAEIPGLLAALGLPAAAVLDIRISRWGHAIPQARVGLLADGLAQAAHAPLLNRLFFAHQDNWCSPALESTFYTALEAAHALRAALSLSG